MLLRKFVLVLSCSVVAVLGASKFKGKHIPDYISPCRASDPELNKCIVEHAKQTIPALLKGDTKYRLPPLVPYKLERVEIRPNNELALDLKDALIYGFDTMKLLDADFVSNKNHAKLTLFADKLKIVSKYNISGLILKLPISGEGPLTMDFTETNLNYSFSFDLEMKEGKQYLSNLRPKMSFKVKEAHIQLDNLFNGNKELGDNMNKLINENSQLLLKEFGDSLFEIFKAVVTSVLQSYLYVIPFDEILLPA